MFLAGGSRGYDRYGQQHAKGRFLILMQPSDYRGSCMELPIHALVRTVRLNQLGHFMMGCLALPPHLISLSGCYGNNGLIRDVPRDVYDHGYPIPPYLQELWAKSEGHNTGGTEMMPMAQWAQENIKRLTKPWRRKR